MILIKKNEITQADVLILDINEDFCQIQSQSENKLDFIVKKKLSKTSCKFILIIFPKFIFSPNSELKKYLSNYKNLLKGKIIIEDFSHGDYNKIKGMIKLKKDPKVENFTIENIILKDSIIINNDWVLGIILFRPEESLFSMNQQRKYMNNTSLLYKIDKFIFICLDISNPFFNFGKKINSFYIK